MQLRYTTSDERFKLTMPRDGDAGYDLPALHYETIQPGEQKVIYTPFQMELPPGTVGIIKDRSSLAAKGIYTHGGVIDSSYRGYVQVLLENRSNREYHINPGDRVAQMLIVPALTFATELVTTLSDTERGAGGFGSTGI